jgi:hypothetical protein
MDDDKKKVKFKALEIEVVLFIVLVIAVIFWPAILSFLQVTFAPVISYLGINWTDVGVVAKSTLGVVVGISFPISLFFLIGIIYCVEQLKRIRNKEAERFDLKVEPAFEENAPINPALGHRWETVETHMSSTNPNDWRSAILEADIILDDILTGLGYQGEGVGEKLKRVVSGDMKSLNEAWEAHKVRNQVAHDGSAFPLTRHEANRVVGLYRKVFEEFYFIQ